MSKYIQIGKIANTHGIRGDIKIIPLTNDMKRFEKLKQIYIEGESTPFEINKVWYQKGFAMLNLKGYDNINLVLKFKDKFILIPKEDAVDLPTDSYFIFDIIGLTVYTSSGEELGIVKDVLQPGANDVYVVKSNNKEILIPAIKEVVKEVNIGEGRIIIEPIEGLIE